MFVVLPALSLGLAACSPFASRTDTQAISDELAVDDWANRIDLDAETAVAWTFFSDPVLDGLIEEALRNSLAIRSQRLSLESTQIQLEASRRRLFPSLGLSGPNAGISRARNGTTQESYGFSGSASYEVDLWGNVDNAVSQQYLSVENARETLQTVRISTAAQVARAYFSLRRQDEVIRLQQEQLKILREQRRLTEVNFTVGEVTREPLDQLDVRIETLLSNIESAKVARQITDQSLANLLGVSAGQFSLPAVAFKFTTIPRIDPDAPAELLRRRPDIRIAERVVVGADLSLETARNAWLPNLGLSAGGSSSVSSTGSLGDLFSGDSIAANVAASLTTLLYDNGARDRARRQSDLNREQAILSYRRVVLNALSDVENALNEQRDNISQIEIQRRQQEAQERVTNSVQIRYQTGDASAFDLIREQQNILNVRQRRVGNWQAGMSATISLLQALGADPADDY